jgi:pseudouridine-5'-phosphate glycosidase
MNPIELSPDVRQAMRQGRPVVALESAVLTTGLPREAMAVDAAWADDAWDPAGPVNLETMRLLVRTLATQNVTPAIVAIVDGRVRVGLDDDEIEQLARDGSAGKVSASGLLAAIQTGASAGTTVSATLAICHRVGPLRVFATGGIGGVHRNWRETLDISGDLEAIAGTQTCVVCAGAKSILDRSATLQRLESLNVPVVGYGTDHLPAFHTRGSADLPVPHRVDSVEDAATLCRTHWQGLGAATGILLANPIPAEHALDPSELESAIAEAEALAADHDIAGAAVTPFLLAELARLTEGRTLDANIALLKNNVVLAADVARQLCH